MTDPFDPLRIGRLSAIRQSGDRVILTIDSEPFEADWPDIRSMMSEQGIQLGDKIEYMVSEDGAIVSIGPRDTYRRESVRLLAHRATPAEIDESLKAAAAGGAR